MIMIGNGPVPLAVSGNQAASGRSVGLARGSPAGNAPAPTETIPAASRGASPPSMTATTAAGSLAVQPVIATSRIGRTITDPEEIPRDATSGLADDMRTETPPAFRPDPVPPLRQFAAVPNQVSAEIERLRTELRDVEERLSEVAAAIERLPAPNEGDAGPTLAKALLNTSEQDPKVAPKDISSEIEALRAILTPPQRDIDTQS